MLTSDCKELLSNQQIDQEYRDCLREFIDGVVAHNPENVETILLYGGLVRDAKVFDKWSDIDLIVVFGDISKRSAIGLARVKQQLESRYSIRIDLSQLSSVELTDESLRQFCYSSEIINALSMREDVSIVLFGDMPSVHFPTEQEKQAAICYISSTLASFRRYLTEVAYKGTPRVSAASILGRIVRWTFSIVRASLRLFDIYSHPYTYSLEYVEQLFPEVDLSLLNRLILLRENVATEEKELSIIGDVESFIESYVPLVMRRYYEEINEA